MEMYDGESVAVPMVRIVFDDLREFVQLENLACHLGMGKDWPIAMLREFLSSYKECAAVGHKQVVTSLPLVSRGRPA